MQDALLFGLTAALNPLALATEGPVGHAGVAGFDGFRPLIPLLLLLALDFLDDGGEGRAAAEIGLHELGDGFLVEIFEADRGANGPVLLRQVHSVEIEDGLLQVAVAGEVIVALVALLPANEGRIEDRVVALAVDAAAGEVRVEIGDQRSGGDRELLVHLALVEAVRGKHVGLRLVLGGDNAIGGGLERAAAVVALVVQLRLRITRAHFPLHVLLLLVADIGREAVRDLVEIIKPSYDIAGAVRSADEIGVGPVRRTFVAVTRGALVAEAEQGLVGRVRAELKPCLAPSNREILAEEGEGSVGRAEIAAGAVVPHAEALVAGAHVELIGHLEAGGELVVVVPGHEPAIEAEQPLLGLARQAEFLDAAVAVFAVLIDLLKGRPVTIEQGAAAPDRDRAFRRDIGGQGGRGEKQGRPEGVKGKPLHGGRKLEGSEAQGRIDV